MEPCEDNLLPQLDNVSEAELDEEGDAEVQDNASLLDFAAILQITHNISAAAERAEEAA